MTREEIVSEISKIEARLDFLSTDRTKWVSAWAQAGPAYDHGPYFRRLERRKLSAKRSRLLKRLARLDAAESPKS